MVWDLFFVLAVIGLASLPFVRMLWKSELEHCRYRLFEIRDTLILLVAQKKLEKNSIVFEHYYRSVNDVIRMTESMRLEGIIQFLRSGKTSKADVLAYNKRVAEVAEELQTSSTEVQGMVKCYYEVLRDMLLVNSNFFSVAYLVSRHHHRIAERLHLFGWIERKEPRVASAFREIETECRQLGIHGCGNSAIAY